MSEFPRECVVRDENHREYRVDKRGVTFGGPVEERHYRKAQIIGETRVSWLVRYNGWDFKFDKETNIERRSSRVGGVALRLFHTRQLADDDLWMRKNRYAIGRAVEALRDADLLREVAELVGYKA